MRLHLRPRLGLASLLLALSACPSDDTGGSGTEDTGTSTAATGTGSETGATEGLDDSTGSPAGSTLMPCDPRDDAACDQGVCAGDAIGGLFCRFPCSSMAESGTPCGSDDVCLPVSDDEEDGLACFDVADCDFLTGAGCNEAAGETCVVVAVDPLRTACVPQGDTGSGEPCDVPGMLDCAPGLTCLGGDLEVPGTCIGWCDPEAPLPDECPACAALNDDIGTCSECRVLGDDCPAGSQCQILNELLGGVCVDVGPGGVGFPCSLTDPAQSCQEGLLCINIDDGEDSQPVCVEGCDPANPMCSGSKGESCVDVDLFIPGAPGGQVGVCLDVGIELCDPMAEPTGCSRGTNCLDIGGGLGICGAVCDPAEGTGACGPNEACFPSDGSQLDSRPFIEGNGACGVGCSTDVDCGGDTCLHLDGLAVDGLCGTTCTPGMPGACPVGEGCVATPEDPGVGACMALGAICNPTIIADCGANACIPMQGETLIGVCLPPCFSQDPVACGGEPTQCQSKTDPIWHTGTCIGGGEPCSLVDDSCGPGDACGVVGGQAFGGQAFICDNEGPLGEGDDCSANENGCGAGVGCFDDVCRAWCDPMADACVTGTCTDVSLGLYLPVGTIGVCQ